MRQPLFVFKGMKEEFKYDFHFQGEDVNGNIVEWDLAKGSDDITVSLNGKVIRIKRGSIKLCHHNIESFVRALKDGAEQDSVDNLIAIGKANGEFVGYIKADSGADIIGLLLKWASQDEVAEELILQAADIIRKANKDESESNQIISLFPWLKSSVKS